MTNDTLASERTLEPASQDGQPARASEAQPQSDTGGQPSDNGKAAQDENIRRLQSTYDKKLAEERRAFQQQQQQANQQIQAMQQRLAQMEEASAPDDYARLELRLKRAEEQAQQYAAAYQQSIAERQAQEEKMSALKEIADEFDVPVSALSDASDYKSAVKLALKAQQEAQRRKQEQDDDKRERNMPDVGSGAPRSTLRDLEQQYEDAKANRDSLAMLRLQRQLDGTRKK